MNKLKPKDFALFSARDFECYNEFEVEEQLILQSTPRLVKADTPEEFRHQSQAALLHFRGVLAVVVARRKQPKAKEAAKSERFGPPYRALGSAILTTISGIDTATRGDDEKDFRTGLKKFIQGIRQTGRAYGQAAMQAHRFAYEIGTMADIEEGKPRRPFVPYPTRTPSQPNN